jgi:molecular chaperone DnaK
MASDNKSLGRFILDGIPPAPRGMPQVEVTFDVDANGILNVKAKDKASGKEQSIRIEASSGLTDADIKRMQEEAEAHKEEDAKKKELVDEKNTAEMMIFSAEKSLKEYGDKIDATLKASVEEKIAKVKTAKDGTDLGAIKSALEELTTEVSKIGEAVQKAGGTPEGQTAEPQNSEVKDAEVNEKPEQK